MYIPDVFNPWYQMFTNINENNYNNYNGANTPHQRQSEEYSINQNLWKCHMIQFVENRPTVADDD